MGVLKNIGSKIFIENNCNRNCRSVSFPCECEFSLKNTNTKYNLLQTCCPRTLATDKETNIIQNMCLTQHPCFSGITTESLWNFSFLEICMHLISNFTCKDTVFKRDSSSCYGIFLDLTSSHPSVLKKGGFEILEEPMLYLYLLDPEY